MATASHLWLALDRWGEVEITLGLTNQPRAASPMTFIAFLAAALLLAITPGPGIAYVVARTASGGRTEGLALCLGTGLGGLVHVAAATLGLSALLAQSAIAFSLVKYLGAAYLIYLGIKLLRQRQPELQSSHVDPQGTRRAFLDGILVEALNVKTALFFLAFLPQFVQPEQPLVPQLALMGCICVALNTLVDVVAVIGAARLLSSSAAYAARAKLMSRVSGTTMLGLGIYLALAKREA